MLMTPASRVERDACYERIPAVPWCKTQDRYGCTDVRRWKCLWCNGFRVLALPSPYAWTFGHTVSADVVMANRGEPLSASDCTRPGCCASRQLPCRADRRFRPSLPRRPAGDRRCRFPRGSERRGRARWRSRFCWPSSTPPVQRRGTLRSARIGHLPHRRALRPTAADARDARPCTGAADWKRTGPRSRRGRRVHHRPQSTSDRKQSEAPSSRRR